MIHIVTGDKGEGKTARLIAEANDAIGSAKGSIVYIDGDNSHIYALRHEIRYINISEFPIDDYHEFYGFICGVLSEDNDISNIYIDGLLKMAHLSEISDSDKLIEKIRALSDKFGVKIVATINCEQTSVPDFLRTFTII